MISPISHHKRRFSFVPVLASEKIARIADDTSPVVNHDLSSDSDKGSEGFHYSGGDGRTPETAVVIENAGSTPAGIRAEKAYISQQLGESRLEWDLCEQALLQREDWTRIDRLKVERSSGETETFYFDVSNFFGT